MREPIDPKCPVCGQGGLLLVRLLDLDARLCVLCQACDAIWEGQAAAPLQPIVRFYQYAEARGVEPDWSRVERARHP